MSDTAETVKVVSDHPKTQGPFVLVDKAAYDANPKAYKLFKGKVDTDANGTADAEAVVEPAAAETAPEAAAEAAAPEAQPEGWGNAPAAEAPKK